MQAAIQAKKIWILRRSQNDPQSEHRFQSEGGSAPYWNALPNRAGGAAPRLRLPMAES